MNVLRALIFCNLAVLILVGLLLAAGPTFGQSYQSYKVSEEKRELIGKFREGLCEVARENNFFLIKTILKNAGKRYIGKEITIDEAYPYLYCHEMMASNIDLIRVAVEHPLLDVFVLEFVEHFITPGSDKTLFARLPMCKRDFGRGCLDVFEHMEKNRRKRLHHTDFTKKYDFLKKILRIGLGQIGGPIRAPEFCREVLDEPRYCHTEKLDQCVAANAARYEDCHRRLWEVDARRYAACLESIESCR